MKMTFLKFILIKTQTNSVDDGYKNLQKKLLYTKFHNIVS
jgi:hypothetical protein